MKSMKAVFSYILILALVFSMVSFCASPVAAETDYSSYWFDEKEAVTDYSYSMVLVGDTQNLLCYDPDNFQKIYDWILENKEEKNIQYVLGLGDITDLDANGSWEVAYEQISRMEGVVPYSLCRGNHDSSERFNRTFNTEPYLSSFDGSYDGNIENTWRTLQVGNIKYLIMTIDYAPSDAVLEWASDVIESHREYNVIITTHGYLYKDGKPAGADDGWSHAVDPFNDGEEMWEKLFSKHENIVFIASGHVCSDPVVLTQTQGDNGNVVSQMLTNHQDVDEHQGSAGIVTVLYFSEDGSQVTVETYSTVREQFYMEENQFTFEMAVVEPEDPEHSYGDWVQTKAPTYTETGVNTKTCTVCGNVVTQDIPVLDNPISGWNVSLGDQIGLNFLVNVGANDVVTCALGDEPVSAENISYKDGSYKVSMKLAAAQMADEISVQVNGESIGKNYSVLEYADSILNGEYDDATKALVRQMLHYGAAAQNYFAYNVKNPVNTGLDTTEYTIPEETLAVDVKGVVDGIRFYGASLIFRSKTAVRYYFNSAEDIDGYSFRVGGNVYTPIAKDGLYYVEVDDIAPNELEELITVTVYDGSNSMSVTYSPMHYILRMYNGAGSEELKLLLREMYGYHVEAKAYVNSVQSYAVAMDADYEMNVADNDLVVSNCGLSGNLSSVTVKGTEITLEGATLVDGILTVPAAAFQLSNMPSGRLSLVVTTDAGTCEIIGNFIWVINTADELLDMKAHMCANASNTVLTGNLALGCDVDMTGVLLLTAGLKDTNFVGTFDGRMHKIVGLAANNSNTGLFGHVSGTVKNVQVLNAYTSESTAPIVGGMLTGAIENVYVEAELLYDGVGNTMDPENLGSSLLAGRIGENASVCNVIVNVKNIAHTENVGSAFGKLVRGATPDVFQNCYVVNAAQLAYVVYDDGWAEQAFTQTAGKAFDTMAALWMDADGAALAQSFGLIRPMTEISVDVNYDLNSSSAENLVVNGLPEVIAADYVYMMNLDGTQIQVPAAVQDGAITIEKAELEKIKNTLATGEQSIIIVSDGIEYCINGLKLIWVINNTTDLLGMKSHLTVVENGSYYGMLALGSDLDLTSVNIKNIGFSGLTFSGEFDGRMHTLSNVKASTGNVGLFGHVSGSIKNLRVVNAVVSSYTAPVVGGTLYGTVENIYVQGKITADGLSTNSNLRNFGCGLIVGKYDNDAQINNCIAELTEIADDLLLATAFGKQHKMGATEASVFHNCYAVNANGCTFVEFTNLEKKSFALNTNNKNFSSMWLLWQDSTAQTLAQKLGITEPEKPEVSITLTECYDMNSASAEALTVADAGLVGTLSSVSVKDTEIVLTGATLDNGVLTIPATAFLLDEMPSGKLSLVVKTDVDSYTVSGNFAWVVNSAEELLDMKAHLTSSDGVTYDGLIALGSDITDELTIDSSNAMFSSSETFAGTFDGRMKSISSINVRTAGVGLFTNVSGKICNLKIMNATVAKNTAPMVGRILTGKMENIYVKGSITADGMYASSNLNNFGCGLLAARYQSGAAVNNVIIEVEEITEGLRLATAFGKLGDYKVSEAIFTNCFAIGAGNAAYMDYQSGQTTANKLAFTDGTTNGNYASYDELWSEDSESTARKLAEETFALPKPSVQIALDESYDMNVTGNDFSVTDSSLSGSLSSVSIKGTEIIMDGATLESGTLIIPAESFQLDDMPSGKLTLLVETDGFNYEITGNFIWVIKNTSELLKMRHHLTLADTTYTGMLALGADLDLANVTIKNSGLSGMTFAGEFDGRFHTLSNLNANTGNIGLFGHVSGTVKNLLVKNAVISSYTAAIVGGSLTGNLENIYVQGSITKDGMAATSNLSNFGAGLLVGRISAGAKINNCIVELTSIADGLRLATAFGKLHGSSASESSFTNCYAINADGCTFMPYNQGWVKQNFATDSTNKNFADLSALLEDETAAELAELLGLV